jgi:hypothetical protein
MKSKGKIVDAEFTVLDESALRSSGRSAPNVKRRGRGHWVTLCLVMLPLAVIKLIFWFSSEIGSVGGEIARIVVVPLMRFVTICVTFTVACLGVMYLGAYAIRGSVAEMRSLADRAHESLNRGTDELLALVPGSEPNVPRAIPVPDGWQPPGDERSPISQAVASVADFAGDAVNLLLPLSGRYPQIDGQPRIDGDILELAGGHRMQELISGILASIEQVESSGCLTLVGDNGKAFGPLQVRREPCEDLAQFFGITVDPKACNGNYELSEYVVRLYLGYWGVQHEMRTGQAATAEVLCRTWNGGPDQGPFDKTDVYWAKCQRHDSGLAQLAAR